MKPIVCYNDHVQSKKKIIIGGGVVLLVLAVVLVWVFKNIVTKSPEQAVAADRVTCASSKEAKTITIDMEGFHPEKMTLHACDILTFQNTDTKYHQPAFGAHPKHLIYPGYPDEPLKPGTSRSVILTAIGTFKIHDHIYDELEGELDILK